MNMRSGFSPRYAAFVAVLIANAAWALPPSFTVVDTRSSRIQGVTRDGTLAVGSVMATPGRTVASMWTPAAGMVLLPMPTGYTYSQAHGAARGGQLIYGNLTGTTQPSVYWMGMTTPVILGDLAGGSLVGTVRGASEDGRVLVGEGRSAAGPEGWRWTLEGGFEGLGDLPGGRFFSLALSVCADGSVITGFSNTDSGDLAFRWTRETGMVSLGAFPGVAGSRGEAISSDGSTIVGTIIGTQNLGGDGAFRWHASTGFEAILTGPGIRGTFAHAVNGNGATAAGTCSVLNEAGVAIKHAFIWDRVRGSRLLKDALQGELALDLGGFRPLDVMGISDDGTVVVGYGTYSQVPSPDIGDWRGFVAVIPPPPPGFLAIMSGGGEPGPICLGDFDGSGGIDGADVEAFFSVWESGDSRADVDASGGVDGDDMREFFRSWESGC